MLQGIDALTPEGDSTVINHLDYVSAVSGGNYMATSVLAGMMQPRPTAAQPWPPSFPYESKTDGSETPETQHLRNYSSFLVPFGAADYAYNLLVVLRGLAVNAVMIAPALFLASAVLLMMHPTIPPAGQPVPPGRPFEDLAAFWPQALGPFVLAPLLALALAATLLWPVIGESRKGKPPTLAESEARGRRIAVLGFALAIVTAVEAQTLVLQAMTATPRALPSDSKIASVIGVLTAPFGAAGTVLAAFTLTLALFAQKLLAVIKATVSTETYAAAIKRAVALGALLALGLSLPLLLYVACLNLTFWGLDSGQRAPDWLKSVAGRLNDAVPTLAGGVGGSVGLLWILVALVLLGLALLTTPNGNSLHRLYRDPASAARSSSSATRSGRRHPPVVQHRTGNPGPIGRQQLDLQFAEGARPSGGFLQPGGRITLSPRQHGREPALPPISTGAAGRRTCSRSGR